MAAAIWNANFSAGLLGRVAQAILAYERFRLGSDMPSRMIPRLTFQAWAKQMPDRRTEFDWLSRDPAEVDKYVADPLCGWDASVSMWSDVFRFVFFGADDRNFESVRKDLPFNLVGGEKDPATDGGKAVHDLAERMARMGFSRVTTRVYAGNPPRIAQRVESKHHHRGFRRLGRQRRGTVDRRARSSDIRPARLLKPRQRNFRRCEMPEAPPPEAPLKGVRVIELARILAGPWAGQLLADLGADVIKVENPDGGDDTRKWGPPFVMGKDGENLSAAYYHSCNRGKRSVAIDFSTPEGADTVRKLVATADVLIENFKLGGLKKYGLDYDSLSKINPRLVYCSITGFGQDGPYAPRAGYDFIIQAMSGMMSITGAAGGEPQKAGVAISDIFTGLYSVIAIQAALAPRRKDRRRPVHRHGAVRFADLGARQPEPQLSRLRRAAGADGQRPYEHRALRGAAGQGRPHHPGGRQ